MLQLASDPYPEVKDLAQSLVNAINLKVCYLEIGNLMPKHLLLKLHPYEEINIINK